MPTSYKLIIAALLGLATLIYPWQARALPPFDLPPSGTGQYYGPYGYGNWTPSGGTWWGTDGGYGTWSRSGGNYYGPEGYIHWTNPFCD